MRRGPDETTRVVSESCESTADTLSERPDIPERVGRYRIEGPLGRGGMGEVFEATDPELDRKVAIKLVRKRDADEDATARLFREAQALARLSHPHVVPVFDVGRHGHQIFIAMELVEGQTLRAWCESERPGWREVLEALRQAGRGLAAAHAAGVLHRDFKPTNVMMGNGRARVLDFGLARDLEAGPGPSQDTVDPPAPRSGESGSLDSLTQVGTVVGTPSYMSPEQFRGDAVDTRSDQFAFCVSAYRLLYGRPPFSGEHLEELRRNVAAGKVRSPPYDTPVPRRVGVALLRGLSPQPQARFDSMDALLDALEPSRGRGAWVATSLLAGGLVLAAVAVPGPAEEAACGWVRNAAEQVWNESARSQIRGAFTATDKPYAGASFDEVVRTLDRTMAAWTSARVEVCEVGTRQESASNDLRAACLDRQLSTTKATLEQLAGADVDVVENAVAIVVALPQTEHCDGQERSSGPDPSVAKTVEALQGQLDRLRPQLLSGKYEAIREASRTLCEEADETGYAPLIGRAQQHCAWVELRNGSFEDSKAAFERARAAFAESGDVRREIDSTLDLASVLSQSMQEHERGLTQVKNAEALVTRLDDPPELVAAVHLQRGRVYAGASRHDDALSEFRAGLELVPDNPERANMRAGFWSSIGVTLSRQGRYADSISEFAAELAVVEKLYGDNHPRTAKAWGNLGSSLSQLGRTEEAMRAIRRAIEIYEIAIGPDATDAATVYHNLGVLSMQVGDPQGGIDALQRAIELNRRGLGPTHPKIAWISGDLGTLLFMENRLEEAVPHLKEAIRIFEASQGSSALGLVYPTSTLIQLLLALDRAEESYPYIERGLQLLEEQKVDPAGAGALRYAAARALWTRGERDRARGLAKQAVEDLKASERPLAQQIADVESWVSNPH